MNDAKGRDAMTHLERYDQILADFPMDSGPLAALHERCADLLGEAQNGGDRTLGPKAWGQLQRLTWALRDLVYIVNVIERDEAPEDDDIPF